jgi:hypothetical protein
MVGVVPEAVAGNSERRGQTLDKGRAMALNAAAIQSFFVNLRRVVQEKDLTDADIYNCNETSVVAAVVDGGYKVLCERGGEEGVQETLSTSGVLNTHF